MRCLRRAYNGGGTQTGYINLVEFNEVNIVVFNFCISNFSFGDILLDIFDSNEYIECSIYNSIVYSLYFL